MKTIQIVFKGTEGGFTGARIVDGQFQDAFQYEASRVATSFIAEQMDLARFDRRVIERDEVVTVTIEIQKVKNG